MRERIFRGKSKTDDKWFFGGIFYCENDDSDKYFIVCKNEENNVVELFPVDPDTIGDKLIYQDRNGKDVYEGDILFDGIELYVVQWYNSEYALEPMFSGKDSEEISVCSVSEIVGNIYDNPEIVVEECVNCGYLPVHLQTFSGEHAILCSGCSKSIESHETLLGAVKAWNKLQEWGLNT